MKKFQKQIQKTKKQLELEQAVNNIDTAVMVAGIDTNAVKSPTYYEGTYIAFSHDATRTRTRNGDYIYRLNPANTGIDTSNIFGYCEAMNKIMEDTDLENPIKSRIDFKFDLDSDYCVHYKLMSLFIELIATCYDIDNVYDSNHKRSAKKLTVRAQPKHGEFEIEYYNKAMQEPDGFIPARLELRSKKLYKCECSETEKEIHAWNVWQERMHKAIDREVFDRLVNSKNDELIQRYSEERQTGETATFEEFVHDHRNDIYTKRQFIDLAIRCDVDRPECALRNYRKTHKLRFFSERQVKHLVKILEKSMQMFFNPRIELVTDAASDTAARLEIRTSTKIVA